MPTQTGNGAKHHSRQHHSRYAPQALRAAGATPQASSAAGRKCRRHQALQASSAAGAKHRRRHAPRAPNAAGAKRRSMVPSKKLVAQAQRVSSAHPQGRVYMCSITRRGR